MAITLAEAKVGMRDKVSQQVIDEFRRSSILLDNLVFDNAISPGTGGSTLTYGYVQLLTPSTASVRAINSDYTANEAKRVEKTSKAIIMGGSFSVDRVLQETSGAIDELAFQASEKIKATANYFTNLVVNGSSKATTDSGFVHGTFDGLRKLLATASTNVPSAVDISSIDADKSNALLDELDEFMATLDGRPTMLLMNTKMLTKVKSAARRAGYFKREETAFGTTVDMYNGIPLVDAGYYYNGTSTVPIIGIDEGKTDIYALNIGLDGFHGISPTGNKVITARMPDLNAPGVMKTGDVELVAGIVLKNSRKAGVLSGITIA